MNVEKFELSTGSYNLDFYLWFKWSGDIPTSNYEFMNGRATSTDTTSSQSDYLEVRVRGASLKSLDFKAFPFDKHVLTIEIKDKFN